MKANDSSDLCKLSRPESLRRLSNAIRHNSFVEPTILNPFCHYLHLSWLEWLKVFVMSFTVAPIRLVFIITTFGLNALFSNIGCLCSTDETFNQRLPLWRRTCRYTSRKMFRFLFFFCGFQYIEIRGKRASPNETMIFVAAPHSSFVDILASLCGPTKSGISKIENKNIIGLGNASKMLQPIWVKRDDQKSRERTVELLTERTNFPGKLPQIIVFPEGTTTNASCLINFKAGAFVPGAPVQPLLIRYPNRIDCTTWTMEQYSTLLMAWVMLCQFHNRCVFEYLPVYRPNEAEKKDAKLFANNVRIIMARALDVPITDHTYDDCRLMRLAHKYNLPQASGVVEFSKLSKKLTLDFKNMSEFLEYFAEISGDLKGKITIDDFSEYLGLPVTPEVQKMFDMYDRNRSGYIDFREYVIGMCLVTMPANTEQSLRLAFGMIDRNKTGEVSQDEFTLVMCAAFNMHYSSCIKLFEEMDSTKSGSISYEDFIQFAKNKPEFIKVVSLYRDFQHESNKHLENGRVMTIKEKLL